MNVEPASIPFILFSDTVIREEGTGKLSIIGSFQHFNVAQFPFISPPFVVTVAFGNLRGRIESLHLTVRIEHSDSGVVLACVGSEMRLHGDISPTDVFEVPLGLPPCQFAEPGSYSVVVLINNEVIGLRPLVIRPAKPRPDLPPVEPEARG